ncbi:MAG: DASS family sodium-coupled anion symporter [Bryobacteraceae bacterium]|nr:DASS family sodium-coupled anion symporter [Bryobacteraceae bacterium]
MPTAASPPDAIIPAPPLAATARLARLAAVVAVYCGIALLLPRPDALTPTAWRLFALFTATVAGLMLEPIPQGALVLIAITLTPVLGGISPGQALSGFGDPTVWLVMAAFFLSRALINTGLARRIALFFVRLVGHNTVGVCYALSLSDLVLAGIIPSNGARCGGVILPIARSISELYGSRPGTSASLLGTYLYTAVYQSTCISAAMFLTGQASNPLAAKMAGNAGFAITWMSWFLAGIVPGLLSLAIIPWIVMRISPPEIHRTPEARVFARTELAAMGPLSRSEWIMAAVFVAVCGMWMTTSSHGLDTTQVALLGTVALLLTGVLSWEDVRSEKAAWDLFIWYGGLVMLGKALNDAKVPAEFARMISNQFGYLGWPLLFTIALGIYYYAHYAFASITAHLLAMYPAFLAILLAKGAPVGLVSFAFACFVCMSAGLTHYGTTPAPMFYGHGYVSFATWWRAGFIVSLANVAVWGTVGFAWWKVLGIW